MNEPRSSAGDRSWLQTGADEEIVVAPPEAGPGAPVLPLLLAALGLLLAVVTLPGAIGLQIVGYLSASLLLFTAVAWFRRFSLERSARHGVATPSSLNVAAWLMLVAGFVLALVHAWNIASHFS